MQVYIQLNATSKNIVVTSYGGLQLSLSNMTKPILPSSLQ